MGPDWIQDQITRAEQQDREAARRRAAIFVIWGAAAILSWGFVGPWLVDLMMAYGPELAAQ